MSRSGRFALVLGGVLVVAVLVMGDPGDDDRGDPLSADGTGATGARATLLLLEELGADVEVVGGVPTDDADSDAESDADTALLLADTLDDDQRSALVEWAADGRTLVVADPSSPLTPVVADALDPLGLGARVDVDADRCDIGALDDVEQLSIEAGVRYAVPGGAAGCFGDGSAAYVVDQPLGSGRLVSLGGPNPFTNAALDREDNAVLVAQLVAPEPEGARIAFLEPGPPVGGEEGLADLVPDQVRLALVQLAVAFLVYVWFRARRAGRPVAEPAPTPLAGSELVAAVGGLLQQEKDPDRAAGLLRADLRRRLAGRLGVPVDAPVTELVAAAERAGADGEALAGVLAGPPVTDGDALTDLARSIDHTRREILHEQP